MLYILSGESGCGKTLWLAQLVAYAQSIQVAVDGLITPAVFEDGMKVGIDCILLPGEEEFRLAEVSEYGTVASFSGMDMERAHSGKVPHVESAPLKPEELKSAVEQSAAFSVRRMPWRFDDQAMARANAHLALITPENPSKTLFVIDELGWLEMNEGRGWSEALRILDQGCYEDAIAVIRPQLLEKAMERWGHMTPCVLSPGGDVRGFF